MADGWHKPGSVFLSLHEYTTHMAANSPTCLLFLPGLNLHTVCWEENQSSPQPSPPGFSLISGSLVPSRHVQLSSEGWSCFLSVSSRADKKKTVLSSEEEMPLHETNTKWDNFLFEDRLLSFLFPPWCQRYLLFKCHLLGFQCKIFLTVSLLLQFAQYLCFPRKYFRRP